MRCSDRVKLIARKLDGSLPEHETLSLEGHLSGCSRCRAELLLQKRIQEALEDETPSGLSVDFTQRVSKSVLEMARPRRRVLRWSYLVPAFSLTAATTVFFVLGTDVLQPLSFVVTPVRETVSSAFATAGGLLVGAGSFVGSTLSDMLAKIMQLLSERTSSLPRVPQPLAQSLLVTLLAVVPAVLGLYRVFGFLRD